MFVVFGGNILFFLPGTTKKSKVKVPFDLPDVPFFFVLISY